MIIKGEIVLPPPEHPWWRRHEQQGQMARVKGEAPASLHKEWAVEDDWEKLDGNPYTSKFYQDAQGNIRATEILTMGIERLHADPPGLMIGIKSELAQLNSESALDGTYSVSGLLDRARACLNNVSGGRKEFWKILVCEPDMSWHDEGHPDLDD